MDSGANSVGESVGESPAPAPEQEARPAEPVTKGRGLRRWRRIPREQQQHREGSPASPGPAGASPGAGAGSGSGAGGEDLAAQLHKRRLGPAADAPKGKEDAAAEEVESSVASVESSFVPPEASPPPAPTRLDPNLGLLIATAGFSVGAGGADSDTSDDRTSKFSTAASAPRHDFSSGGFGRDRDRARSRAPGGPAHGKNLRAARGRGASARAAAVASPVEAENSRSSVESNLRSSSAAHARRSSAGITSNGVHKVLFPDDHQSDDEPPSVGEVRYGTGAFYKENGSVVGRLAMGNCDSDANNHIFDEASVGKYENGGTHTGLDPYVESIALLQSAQEALENEIQKFVEIRNETDENSSTEHSEKEWSSTHHPGGSAEELSEKVMELESKLEEASVLISERDLKILELDAQIQLQDTAVCNSNLVSLQSDLEQLLLEKMEAEIQCFILTRAAQAWKAPINDQFTLYEAQKSLSGDHKSIEKKLQHSENRALMLEEMVDKLELQCKELSETSEVLKLQARASKASLFCSIQLLLLCIAMGTLLVRFLPSSPELVPT